MHWISKGSGFDVCKSSLFVSSVYISLFLMFVFVFTSALKGSRRNISKRRQIPSLTSV